jgi:HAE1 family hydrophobic/amphiphilic exporter-1
MNLSEPFIKRPVMTAVLTVSVILFGILSYISLPVNDLPSVDYPVIQVQANYPGASPDTVANNIATPLERQFMQINGLEMVTSQSTQGNTRLTLQFALDKNIDAAATDVQTAISQATGNLPTDLPSPPTYSKTNPNDQPIMYIALTSDSVTRGQLYDYGSTQVGERISILPGVSRVDVFGTKSAIRIKTDPSAMWARGISIDDLSAAIRNGTSYVGAGQFDSRRARHCFARRANSKPLRHTAISLSAPQTAPRCICGTWPGYRSRSRTSELICAFGLGAIRSRRPPSLSQSTAGPAPMLSK